MSQQTNHVKLALVDRKDVLRPYSDYTSAVTEGVYATPTFDQLIQALRELYMKQGMELLDVKPVYLTLRKYHDNNPTSDIADQKEPEGTDDGQPADQ